VLGKSPRSRGDIRMKIFLLTQVVLYTKTNSLYTTVTCTLTNNTTVLIIDPQAHQGRLKREDKRRWEGISRVRLAL